MALIDCVLGALGGCYQIFAANACPWQTLLTLAHDPLQLRLAARKKNTAGYCGQLLLCLHKKALGFSTPHKHHPEQLSCAGLQAPCFVSRLCCIYISALGSSTGWCLPSLTDVIPVTCKMTMTEVAYTISYSPAVEWVQVMHRSKSKSCKSSRPMLMIKAPSLGPWRVSCMTSGDPH